MKHQLCNTTSLKCKIGVLSKFLQVSIKIQIRRVLDQKGDNNILECIASVGFRNSTRWIKCMFLKNNNLVKMTDSKTPLTIGTLQIPEALFDIGSTFRVLLFRVAQAFERLSISTSSCFLSYIFYMSRQRGVGAPLLFAQLELQKNIAIH